ncbi:unnamed protein product [Heligmosomoides polygyrus]|uniref:Uncharacterized protein n=1 Tax=Heligmosomoides polygyrus TaxID=6339 RepID=A0A183FMS5_HELPZ|nr:unnamed protein product [Heligmosomoides polygyrus]
MLFEFKCSKIVAIRIYSVIRNLGEHNYSGNVGLQLNLTKTMFMRNGQVSDAPFSLNGTSTSECSSYVYLGREANMANDLAPELERGDERLGKLSSASKKSLRRRRTSGSAPTYSTFLELG